MAKLTDRTVKVAVFCGTGKSDYADGGGLYLRVNAGGSKSWVYRFRFNGKYVNYTIGQYPVITLAQARQLHLEARAMVANGINPAEKKREEKREAVQAEKNTFAIIAAEWLKLKQTQVKESTFKATQRYLNRYLLPELGNKRIEEIKRVDMVEIADRLNEIGVMETARNVLQTAGQIFEFAILRGVIEYNPVSRVVLLLKKVEPIHFPALPENEIQLFFEELILSKATTSTKAALLLLMLTAARNGALRQSKWENIDFDAGTWFMPAETMKKGNDFIIPLSAWALEILDALYDETGEMMYLFPNCSRGGKSLFMSENTLNTCIKTMGFDGKTDGKSLVVAHGFRSLFADVCMKQGYSRELIQKALGHTERDKTFAAYYRADMIEERRAMMNFYSEWLREQYEIAKHRLKARLWAGVQNKPF